LNDMVDGAIEELADNIDIDLSGVDFDKVDTIVESVIAPENMVSGHLSQLQGYSQELSGMAFDFVNA